MTGKYIPFGHATKPMERRLDDLMQRMTLEDKIGGPRDTFTVVQG